MSLAPPCTKHPERNAGWTCQACGALLCAESCAAWRKVGQGTMELCLSCGGSAEPIKVRRALAEPFGLETLQDAVRWPFHKEGLVTAAACALVLWLLGLAGLLGGLIGMGIVLAVCFHVTEISARGEDELRDAGDFRGFFEHVIGPVIRVLLAAWWAYGPVFWYAFWRKDMSITPVAVLLLAVGAFLSPMALLVAALGTPLHQILNPLVVIGYPIRLGRDYALLAGFALAISLCESLLMAILNVLDAGVHLPAALQYAVLLLPPLMLFRAMGLLVRVRGDELGYGGESGYLVPVLGRLRPVTEQRAVRTS